MLDKSSVYNVLVEGMHILDKVVHQVSNAYLKLSKFPMWSLKTGVGFSINFAPFCNILAKT